jgi:Flp pilus assembly CpaF family ATPase
MLTIKDIYKLQADYSVADGSFAESEISFEDYMIQCRIFLTSNLPEEYYKSGWDAERQQTMLLNLASKFVDEHKVRVRGYVSIEGIVDSELLLEDVCDAVSGASILKEALEDPEVDEIQINDKDTVFVSRKGVLVYYVDSKGRIKKFVNNEEIHIVLNKLIDDGTGSVPQFTDGRPILSAKTAKHQYRINAVHFVANTRAKPPLNFAITNVTIRKFKEVKLTVADLVEHHAVTPKMGRLLELLGRAELKLFCVGPTGSGKTTLLNIIAGTIPFDRRIILIQNPTEISFMERDEFGRNTRNVVHWEVVNAADMETLISNSLRSTPEVIIIGEAREASEFFQIQRAMRTGHKVLGTFHAEDALDGVGRFATELSSVGGTSYMESLRLVSDTIDIIISQFKFPDGRRRVMEIAEVDGIDEKGNVKVNVLFEFQLSGETRKNEYGLTEVLGEFKQVGTMSPRIQKMFYKAGVSKDVIAEFLTVSDSQD